MVTYKFSAVYLKSNDCNGALEWISIQILVNFKIFNLS